MANFKYYSYDTEDNSSLLPYTFSNLGDLKYQLYYSWLQLIYLLKESLLYYYNYCNYKYIVLLYVEL